MEISLFSFRRRGAASLFAAVAISAVAHFPAIAAAAPAGSAPNAADRAPALLSVSSGSAEIFVDGERLGPSPVEASLAPGRHVVGLHPKNGPATFAEFETGRDRSEHVFQVPPPTCPTLVSVEPEGATVTLDGSFLGQAPVLVPQLPEGRHKFEFAAPGFKSGAFEDDFAAPEPRLVRIALQPATASLEISSEPAGAEVSVNGAPRGRSPISVSSVPEGDVTVEVRAGGHSTWSRALRVAAGDSVSLHAVLEPVPAALAVVSIPDGARVYLDDAFKGVAPLTVENVAPGQHRVRVELADHDPMARNVYLAAGSVASEEFRLRGNVGSVRIATSPAGAVVSVDSRPRGTTAVAANASDAVSDALVVSGIPVGEHTLAVSRPGWKPLERQIVVERDKTLDLGTVSLKRSLVPDTIVETRSGGTVQGVFIEKADGFYRLETQQGVIRSIPLGDIVRIRLIRSDGNHVDSEP